MLTFLWRAFGVLLMLSALALPLVRAPDRTVDTLVARWAPPPSDFIDLRGQLVHVRDEGPRWDPTPLVLIHGTSSSLHTWQGWVTGLKERRRVITFDLPGFGLTGPFAGSYTPDDYSGDALARFTLDLMDRLKVRRAVMVGNSLGGEVAWRVASLAPERVASLVLVDASGYRFTPDDLPLGFRLARNPAMAWIGETLLPRSVIERSVYGVYADPRRVTPEVIDRYYELTLREGNRRALRLRLAGLEADLAPERIPKLRVPTLVLWGGKDKLIPPAVGAQFARDIIGAKLVVLDELGHVPQEENPERSLAPVREFLGLR